MNPKRRRHRPSGSQPPSQPQPAETPSAAQRFQAAQERQKLVGSATQAFADKQDFLLDDFQLKAAFALENGSSVLVAAPTGAGKTVVAEFATSLALDNGKRVFYTTPIKALSNQKYRDFVAEYGPADVGLLTGDVAINGDAPIVVMTTEVLRNMLYSSSQSLDDLAFVVLDEVHYLADRFRGQVWEEVILHLDAHVLIVALSATVSNAEEFGRWIESVRGQCEVVVSEKRPVPLKQHMVVAGKLLPLYRGNSGKLNPELVSAVAKEANSFSGRSHPHRFHLTSRSRVIRLLQDADILPAIYFIFSRQGCEHAVAQLTGAHLGLTTAWEKQQINEIVGQYLSGINAADYSTLGLDQWQGALEDGVAAHHAGLLPLMKECVEELFSKGLLKVVFATETLSLGINMPARTVVIESLQKWDGSQKVRLSAGEFTQLVGRAGRRGIDRVGHGVVLAGPGVNPPAVAALASKRTYPLNSAFRPNYNMAVNLLTRTRYPYARSILERSFAQFQADAKVVKTVSARISWQEQAESAKRKAACSKGDFAEYAQLQEQFAQLKSAQNNDSALSSSKLRSQQDIGNLTRGDVIAYRKGRHNAQVLVAESAPSVSGYYVVTAVTTSANLVHLNGADLAGTAQIIGHMNLRPSTNPESAKARVKLAGALKAALRDGTFKRSAPKKLVADSDTQQLSDLKRQIEQHPCRNCPDVNTHFSWWRKYTSAHIQAVRLQREIDAKTATVTKEFDGVCQILSELKYLTQDHQVTALGARLAGLYCENDLLLALSLERDDWSVLEPAEVAALAAAFLGIERGAQRDIEVLNVPTNLKQSLNLVAHHAKRLTKIENHYGITPSLGPSFGICEGIYLWAKGFDLEACLDSTGLSAGDFVRVVKQVLDLLGQIVKVDSSLDQISSARKLMRRGVVAWSEI